jgi:hypothetical protein
MNIPAINLHLWTISDMNHHLQMDFPSNPPLIIISMEFDEFPSSKPPLISIGHHLQMDFFVIFPPFSTIFHHFTHHSCLMLRHRPRPAPARRAASRGATQLLNRVAPGGTRWKTPNDL